MAVRAAIADDDRLPVLVGLAAQGGQRPLAEDLGPVVRRYRHRHERLGPVRRLVGVSGANRLELGGPVLGLLVDARGQGLGVARAPLEPGQGGVRRDDLGAQRVEALDDLVRPVRGDLDGRAGPRAAQRAAERAEPIHVHRGENSGVRHPLPRC
jgi:hypothetical protein